MKTQAQADDRLHELLTAPRTIASLLETMMPEGYTRAQIYEAAVGLDLKDVKIGKGRNAQRGWSL